jgi:hypothetical protein
MSVCKGGRLVGLKSRYGVVRGRKAEVRKRLKGVKWYESR